MPASLILTHLLLALVLVALSAGVVRAMIRWPILDVPNARSAHTVVTPRGGGLGPVVAFIFGMLALYQSADVARIAELPFLGVILAAVAIAAVGLLDDIRNLSAGLRLLCQFGAAMVAVLTGLVLERLSLPGIGTVELGFLGVLLTLFWIMGCTNAVNFMDGLDGLVAGTLVIACAALGVIALSLGGGFIYAASLFLTAGFLGFLPFNLHRARIFMGDVGSQFAGFMLAILAVAAAGFEDSQVSFLIVPLLIFGLLFDAGFTLLRRALMGERLGAAHRTHLYQMAQRAGVPVRGVAALHWAFTLFHAGLAVWFLNVPAEMKPLVGLPALAVQLAWAGYVMLRMRRAGLGFS
ncbi:glycosyltransferase family 4 protein [Sediminicoccus sp. KRV36]|uniref:glycosyltransferase family 4 protein n=1 Tax=Sediminicoccus sp. KRV36 TaxID=3133721 RepID=UPI00200E7071|nr:glycosyltransferase family 4 protein [Sediminicoccus rosea]UPY37994.1 glycosyltransferase family 4 protein [Sediminicoccus rosea]